MPNILRQLLLFTALTLLLPTAQAGETLQRVLDFKTLNVGMSADQPPMTARNRNGGLMGYDVDLARAMANAMRVQLEIKVMPFSELIAALEKDEIDMIISNMSITPERAEQVTFLGPYMMAGKSILTRNSILAQAQESGAFNREDLKLVAIENSTSAVFISEAAPQAQLLTVEQNEAGVEMVIKGEADAMIADMAVAKLAVLRHPNAGLATLKEPLTLEPVGIAVSKDDPQFQNLVDNYLDAYGKTGLLAGLRKKWFEDGSWVGALP
jgi:polar amino acid transport system substrate-binding protein